ncbi:hypothetical protein KIN20_035327 [Parelaphostrongylus tenuis]|uniref:Uncharacterized protein n=1 Tax=Parelaphostrongylus tenuis TaxID=148309 RepID=A0AAD5WJL6_PARTN|nr:hypothetical protein KIN20_035327 [Parelaphostrongylus tenuis]
MAVVYTWLAGRTVRRAATSAVRSNDDDNDCDEPRTLEDTASCIVDKQSTKN